jgi:hypothetical protein
MKEIIRAKREIFSNKIEIYLRHEQDNGVWFAEPVVMTRREAYTFVEPHLRIDTNSAQMLMDELWNCGLRPSEGSGSAGALAATERHLADMQKLVFKTK